jgi:hypothetical protein
LILSLRNLINPQPLACQIQLLTEGVLNAFKCKFPKANHQPITTDMIELASKTFRLKGLVNKGS